MRVTHVITRLIVGGAQENTISSVLGLQAKAGLDVNLISGPTSGPEGSLESAFARSREILTLAPHLVRPVNPWKDWLAWKELVALFRQRRPDIVHTHSGKAGVLGRLAAARAGVPVILHTIHGPSFGTFQGPIANWIFRAAERRAGRVTTHFVAVADAMKWQYLAAGIGHSHQYTRILSGFALEPFLASTNDPQLRAKLGLSHEDVVIGMISRLFKLKGHDDLFAVAPDLVRADSRIKLLLVGDGPWRRRFEARAISLGLEKQVRFAGLVPPEAVPQFVGIMDLLVHLSLREGLPRALPQALAAGKPVVAYETDGANEVCLHGETGLLVRPGDLIGLHQRLLQLVQNPALRQQLGNRGQAFVKERFGIDRMVDALYELYLRFSLAAR